ncbi:MAG: hypothetical protein ACOYOB_07775 [Myxococcota bacterium]
MIPALIDLHVRPMPNEQGRQDIELLAVQARDQGLDGLVVIGDDTAVDLGETSAVSDATGIQLFSGVALDSDLGQLLCYPREIDDWFRGCGWRTLEHSNGGERAVYRGADVLRVFAERGGAVVMGAPDAAKVLEPVVDDSARPIGVAGIVVTGSLDPASAIDDRTLLWAQGARIACVGGSASAPGQDRFGTVATLFAAPPTNQEAMVEGLRSGRVWPAELGHDLALRNNAPAAPRKPDKPVVRPEEGNVQPRPAVEARQLPLGVDGNVANRPIKPAFEPRPKEARPVQPAPAPKTEKRGKVDPFERPGDNRGNRLNREEVRRQLFEPTVEEAQPTFDPVAAMYGLDGRRALRNSHKTDTELDRINGNRSRGPDPNVMFSPIFDDMRPERQMISLLFSPAEEKRDLEDSVALRFALTHFKSGNLPPRDSGPEKRRGGGRPVPRRRGR